MTVAAWIEADHASAEGMESVVSQWDVRPLGDTAAFDAGEIGGLMTQGYYGAVFDGRRVLFAPMQFGVEKFHANVLAYDTWQDFRSAESYSAYDASSTDGLDTRGYYGGVFDGKHVHFVPRKTEKNRHSRLLRWDSTKPLEDRMAWKSRDAGVGNCRQGAAFDGRYIYYAPGFEDENPHEEHRSSGRVLRLDTQADFDDPSGLAVFDMQTLHPEAVCYDGACFDGRHVYFAPLSHPVTVRYDTQADFADPRAWEIFEAADTGMKVCVGAIFDGIYVYYVPYGHGCVVRYDTREEFFESGSWQSFAADAFRPCGYDGAIFDGRYVTFIPFVEVYPDSRYQLHSRFLVFDTLGDFFDEGSWQSREQPRVDDLAVHGYNGGAFDGRFFYCAPWREKAAAPDGHVAHGRILRTDTAVPGSLFSLQWSTLGHNGGLGAAASGPAFILQTTEGVRSVRANRIFAPGRHHLAATYDGGFLRLYVDGNQVAEQATDGASIEPSLLPVTTGAMAGGGARFRGRVLEWEVLDEVLSGESIRERVAHWSQEATLEPQLVN